MVVSQLFVKTIEADGQTGQVLSTDQQNHLYWEMAPLFRLSTQLLEKCQKISLWDLDLNPRTSNVGVSIHMQRQPGQIIVNHNPIATFNMQNIDFHVGQGICRNQILLEELEAMQRSGQLEEVLLEGLDSALYDLTFHPNSVDTNMPYLKVLPSTFRVSTSGLTYVGRVNFV